MAYAVPPIRISRKGAENAVIVIFLLAMAILVGASVSPRLIDPYSDLGNYQELWEGVADRPLLSAYEPGFMLLVNAASPFISFESFLWLIKAILLGAIFVLTRTLIKSVLLSLLCALVMATLFPPFLSIGGVAIRQGLATSIFMVMLASGSLNHPTLRNTIIPLALMLAFHYSAAFIFIGLCAFLLLRGRKPFYLWGAMLILYVSGISGQIGLFLYQLLPLEIPTFAPHAEYRMGFKLTFFALGVLPVVFGCGLAALGMLRQNWSSLVGQPLFRLYLILNALAMSMSQFPFHDRFFIWSWVIVPFLLLLVLQSMKTRMRPR